MHDIDLDAAIEAKPYVHETQELEQTQLAVRDQTLFHATDPAAIVAEATSHAKALADVLEQQKLYTPIQGRNHVLVEGWTLLGSMLGVYPVCVWTRKVEVDGSIHGSGWEARVEARRLDGTIVGAAEAQCLRGERNWKDRDDFALRSMAQTRATSKALRLPLGFVVVLAGYEATPAEEMVQEAPEEDLTPILEASIEHVRSKKGGDASAGNTDRLSVAGAANTAPPLKPEVQEMLAKAKANREAAEADLRRGKEFPMESCPKCGGLVKVYTSAKGYKFEQCEAVRKDKTGRVHAEGGHHYKRLP